MAGTHDFDEEPRNATVLVSINGRLRPRAEALVSVFDSGFLMGDGVWEGLRLYNGKVPFLDAHLDRLYEGAKALDLNIGKTRAELVEAIYATTRANEMSSGVHIRLMVTRGLKRTPFQGPSVNIGAPTIVVAAEWNTDYFDPTNFVLSMDLNDVPGYGPLSIEMGLSSKISGPMPWYGTGEIVWGPGMPFGDGVSQTGTWSAQIVPAPGAIALLGLGGLARRRRRD